MGAKITLTGQAKDIQKHERSVSFYILTGPATQHPPRGLKLFGQTRYHIECTLRQWRRARLDASDNSDLTVEGYLEPRREPETGHLYVAVVAMSVQSTLTLDARKLEQLQGVLVEAREAFRQAKDAGIPREALEEKATAFVKANESVQEFLGKHPELANRRPS
jgi:hypothetical protein